MDEDEDPWYEALANVGLLRQLLPARGPASRAQLARRLLLAARSLGAAATPAQRQGGYAFIHSRHRPGVTFISRRPP